MKRIRKAARITSVIAAAILTALVVTVLCAPEEDRIALTEALDSLSDQESLEGRSIGTAFPQRSSHGWRCQTRE